MKKNKIPLLILIIIYIANFLADYACVIAWLHKPLDSLTAIAVTATCIAINITGLFIISEFNKER